MPFENPVTMSLATSQTYVAHAPQLESPLDWTVNKITSSKTIRKDRWKFNITTDPSNQKHVGFVYLTPAIPGHQWDINLAQLAQNHETITISVAFNATSCQDLTVTLSP